MCGVGCGLRAKYHRRIEQAFSYVVMRDNHRLLLAKEVIPLGMVAVPMSVQNESWCRRTQFFQRIAQLLADRFVIVVND